MCPEASFYSSVLNVTKLWPSPCVWVEAKLARKKGENNGQHSFNFREKPRASLVLCTLLRTMEHVKFRSL